MAVLAGALDSGITHFDTARMYGLGRAEAELGAFLRTVERDTVTIATKFGIDVGGAARRLARFQGPARSVAPQGARAAPHGQTAPGAVEIRAALRHGRRGAQPRREPRGARRRPRRHPVRSRPTARVTPWRAMNSREFFEGARRQGKIRAWGVSQDEGLETDFAEAFAPHGVSQLRSDLLDPSPRPADIAFGVFDGPYRTLSAALRADPGLARRWRETLQADPLAPGALTKLILASSAGAMGCRAILYSTTKTERVAEAAAAVSRRRRTPRPWRDSSLSSGSSGRVVPGIRGARDFAPGMTVETDVAVVGAGPIGIVTALELAGSGVRVVLIESGLERNDRSAQELSKFGSVAGRLLIRAS